MSRAFSRQENDFCLEFHPKVRRTRPSLLSAVIVMYCCTLRGKNLKTRCVLNWVKLTRSKTMFQPSLKERSTRSVSMKPTLRSIDQSKQEPMPNPPSIPKPNVSRTHPKHSCDSKPTAAEYSANTRTNDIKTKSPSTLKGLPNAPPTVSWTRPKILSMANQKLSSSYSYPASQALMKQPLSSVQLENNFYQLLFCFIREIAESSRKHTQWWTTVWKRP